MSITQEVEVRQGVWIDEQWLQSAGLGDRLKVIVQSGEIRIVAAALENAKELSSKQGWEAFRALGRNASAGKLANAARNHDLYLYGKQR